MELTQEQADAMASNMLAITEWAIRAYSLTLLISSAPDSALDLAAVKDLLNQLNDIAPSSIEQAGSLAVIQALAENGKF